ncbi:GMC oxidoreductase [Caulobacter hibisci]|uniref:GMC family oxidoreductase n=1 Tax=Caulobacter hibisci TaxID=2035993 RepID=A0ABS0T592_9CAUL|nr:GMC family oxidoreductase [Caulobacter hibisci]MBI1687012.1 GMC family oxidoreductase [Caulobacter hibisci]
MLKSADPSAVSGEHYDLVIVGTGFGSSFYLHKVLEQRRAKRILVVEWGDHHPHDWQMENERNTAIRDEDTYSSNSKKPWNYTIGFGGGTNCWFAQTPRLHPTDFKLKTLYGVGADWPMTYEDLEPFYGQAEDIMSIAGDPDSAVMFPRSTPYPQPPHRPSTPDQVMKAAQPGQHFIMPTARARVPTKTRSACCANLRCYLCPADAKFTANNGLTGLYEEPSVTLLLRTQAVRFEADNSVVRKLIMDSDGRTLSVTADRFVLGANAIQSPAILHRSGMAGGLTGVGLTEAVGVHVEALLKGMDNFDGSTITTGLNFGLYDGAFRSEYSGALIYFDNRWTHGLRPEPGRWRQSLPLMIVCEDLPQAGNTVTVDNEGGARVTFGGPHAYAQRGLEEAQKKLPGLLAPLPVEKIIYRYERPTESHLQCTLRMGRTAEDSVIDDKMIHHRWRNLTVVGTAAFSTCSCVNPSLTAAALSLRAASLA